MVDSEVIQAPAVGDAARVHRTTVVAAAISVAVGATLLGVKFWGYRMTGSAAVLSDALESIINVVAAGFAFWVLRVVARPADRSHPYGHGKLEFISAVFEGGLICFAAALIVYEAIAVLVRGAELRRLDLGLAVVLGAGLANLALGFFLVRTGRRTGSITLMADGQHVLSDFWTSAGVVLGLALVRVTGLVWLDPVVALLVGLNLGRTGILLVRRAGGGLVDEEDPELIARLLAAFERTTHPGIIRLHHLRAIRQGRTAHVDAHLVVPEFWPVDRAHDIVEEFERRMIGELHIEGEIIFHTDPCKRAFCPACDVDGCAVRRLDFLGRPPVTLEEAVRPDPPHTFLEPVDSETEA